MNIGSGDEIVIAISEHHSNLVPWQLLAKRKGAVLKFWQLKPESETLDLEDLQLLLGLHVSLTTKRQDDTDMSQRFLTRIGRPGRVKLVAVAHVSNVLGREFEKNYFSDFSWHKYFDVL